ncbi:MAG: hypothetical protein AB7G44_15310 [Bacteroidia bacterium]
MSEAKRKRLRHYEGEDSALVQRSRTLHSHFLNHLAAFTDFAPGMNAAYAATWLSQIEDCEQHPTDESTLDQQQQYTDELEQARKEGFQAANDLEFWVKKAFPDDEYMLEEFGFNERKKARARTLNQLIWLEVMKQIANDYTAELAAAGMPPAILTNLDTKRQNAVDKEITQEYFKRIRKRLARQRLKKYNTLYKICTTVRDAAQSVFYNQDEERGLFSI